MTRVQVHSQIQPVKRLKRRFSIFDTILVTLLLLFSIAALYPFYNIYIYAFNDGMDALKGPLYLWPRKFSVQNFAVAFSQKGMLDAFKISVLRTVIGTFLALAATSSLAYAMTKRKLPGYKVFAYYFFGTFIINGGLVPYFLTIRELGLYDTFWILIIPGMYSFWNMILFRSFFDSIPVEIEESAKIDGASYFRMFISIFVPLSKPCFAALALFISVGLWNDWFTGLFFIKNANLVPLQTLLQQLMLEADMMKKIMLMTGGQSAEKWSKVTPYSIRLAIVVISVTPIIMVYPFLQKYIVKGVMIGAVKG